MSKQTTNPRRASASQAGFTLVEIVIACIIVGILTAILIPTISKRAEDAKISAAESDLQHIADGEERCTIDIGAMVRIYALNDVSGGDGIPNTVANSRINGLSDNAIAGGFYRNGDGSPGSDQIFISPTTQNFLPVITQQSLFTRLIYTESGFQVQWHGPYVNWKSDVNRNDWPDDPWGNDYVFLTRSGILYPTNPLSSNPANVVDHSMSFQITGQAPTNDGLAIAGIFDRPTILSLGPNGLPGDGSGNATTGQYGAGDDLFRSFGGQ